MKVFALELVTKMGGPCRAYDSHGNEVPMVAWIDADAGTFGQYVVDEDGKQQLDPDDRSKAWIIERIGRLRLERMGTEE